MQCYSITLILVQISTEVSQTMLVKRLSIWYFKIGFSCSIPFEKVVDNIANIWIR